jgi:hypothetical protein
MRDKSIVNKREGGIGYEIGRLFGLRMIFVFWWS